MTVMAIPEEIERVVLLGWHVYPASQYSRAACFSGASSAASCDLDAIARWASDYPGCNWRVVFGPSGLWGIDCDVPPLHEDGVSAFKAIIAQHSPLPPRPVMQSGSGGIGIFFRHNGEPIRGQSGYPAPGIDPRRGQLSQTIPPSRHVDTGGAYRWLVPPWEVSPPDAPRWLLDLMAPPPLPLPRAAPVIVGDGRRMAYACAALKAALARIVTAPAGQANDTLNREAYGMARFVVEGTLSDSDVRDALMVAARHRAIPIREAMATINSGIRART